MYVAFIIDVLAQRIVGWHAQTTKHTESVMIPLRMALWERNRQGHPPKRSTSNYSCSNRPVLHPPVESGQYTSFRFTERLALEEIAPSMGTRRLR